MHELTNACREEGGDGWVKGGDGWVGGWIGGWVDGWMGGWVGEWMGGWVEGWVDACTHDLPVCIWHPRAAPPASLRHWCSRPWCQEVAPRSVEALA